MALEIFVENEKGVKIDQVSDMTGRLVALINQGVNEDWKCLQFIDPYGDTTFNRLQINALQVELQDLYVRTRDQTDREILDKFSTLIDLARQHVHHYIKIYGD